MLSVSTTPTRIYVASGSKIIGSNGEVGTVPISIRRYHRVAHRDYFLDLSGQLWCNGQLLTFNVRDFNEHAVLFAHGVVATLTGSILSFPASIVKIGHDLALDVTGQLYNLHGKRMAVGVADFAADGFDVVIRNYDHRLRWLRDEVPPEGIQAMLDLSPRGKMVLHHGSILVLQDHGVLLACGDNNFCECGSNDGEVTEVTKVPLPVGLTDFNVAHGVGWGIGVDGQVYVWGFNDAPYFPQWADEIFVSPRRLF